jgi:uncharacterized OB-fold protein
MPHPDFATCTDCGKRMLPVLDLPPCGHDAPQEIAPLDTPGVVYAWTRAWSTLDQGTLMAMADFLDGSLRVTAPLVEAEEVAIGDEVVAVEAGGAYALRRVT